MEIKCFEVRDRNTCIPVLAIKMVANTPVETAYLRRYGFPKKPPYAVVMMRLDDQRASSDPYHWGDRTHQMAHNFIYDKFDDLRPGQVVDVRVILGEEKEPALPEIWEGRWPTES